MTLDLGDIGQPSYRESVKLPVERSSDTLADTGFPYTWRSNHADDFPFDGTSQFTDSQEFKDSIFDILQSVVIFIQDLSGM